MMGAVDASQSADAMATATTTGTPTGGDRIVHLNLIGTALFVVTASLAAAIFDDLFKLIGVVVALVLFAVGVFAFIWSYITAVQRSRSDNIAVAQLYFLASGSTPKRVQRLMMSALTVQVVVGLATAIARNRTDGRAGSTLAFGILVPMFGLGLNGLWCSKFGSFSARRAPGAPDDDDVDDADVDDAEVGDAEVGDTEPADDSQIEPNSAGVPPSDDEMEQNSTHG